ncbi:hypothetical protein [Alkalibaculum bacchi]|nr:hypothetical protein [Alkalibaculum bacchi]
MNGLITFVPLIISLISVVIIGFIFYSTALITKVLKIYIKKNS